MKLKNGVFILLLISVFSVFSEETPTVESQTEAGSVCLNQDCLSTEGILQQLQETTSDQMCKAMQSKPECKGVDKDHLRGCPPSSSTLAKIGEGALQCVIGLYDGIETFFVSMYNGIKGIFSDEDDEDPGLKAYLHAEFESNSQGFGAIVASLGTAGSAIGLLYNAMADVYSCLNGVGLAKKICQFVSNAPLSGFTGALAGGTLGLGAMISGGMFGSSASTILGAGTGLGFAVATYDKSNEKTPVVTGAAMMLGIILGASWGTVGKVDFKKAVKATVKPMALAGAALGATVGTAVTHDLAVQERIKERMKIKIEEFKKQEESQTTVETAN